MVLVEECDDVATPDAAFGQRSGQPPHPVVPLRPRPGPVQIGHGFAVGLGFGPVRQPFVEEAGFSQIGHGTNPAMSTCVVNPTWRKRDDPRGTSPARRGRRCPPVVRRAGRPTAPCRPEQPLAGYLANLCESSGACRFPGVAVRRSCEGTHEQDWTCPFPPPKKEKEPWRVTCSSCGSPPRPRP